MYQLNKIFYGIIIMLLVCLAGCDKNELRLTQYDLPSDKAYVRFALLSPGTPAVMIKVNDVKINGATTSGSTGLFPSVVNTPDYAAITPNGVFKLSLPNLGTANDSVLLFNGALTVESGKFYSVALADTGVDRTVFANEDKLGAIPDSGFFNIRMVNATPKTASVSLIRIDSTSATAVIRDTIARNIPFKGATDYIRTSISPAPTYSFLRFRTVTNTGVLLASSTPPAPSGLSKRSITIYASGYAGGAGVFSPTLSNFIYNQ